MFFEKARWVLDGSDKKLRVRLSAKSRSFSVRAVFDTGADSCVFPASVREALFPDGCKGVVFNVQGVGGPLGVVAHYVRIEVFSDDGGEVLVSVKRGRCLFAIDGKSPFSLLGVNGFMDQFCWKLDYLNGFMTAS